MKRKCLAVGIILLFVGIAVAPSVNQSVVTASQEDDLVEVTTQACGIQGYGDTTVKLTQEQYKNLQQSLAEFKERVYQTTTREETNEVFNKFIVELNSYGLLGGLSVKQAQRLVRGISSQYFIHGEAKEETYFLGPLARIPIRIINFINNKLLFLSIFSSIIGALVFQWIIDYCTYIEQKQTLSIIFYGVRVSSYNEGSREYPASGSIWISGPDGNISWNGTFYGAIHTIFPYLNIDVIDKQHHYYPGVMGFTGLRMYSNSTNVYFGFARKVAISLEP
jgi:hypothetical protein